MKSKVISLLSAAVVILIAFIKICGAIYDIIFQGYSFAQSFDLYGNIQIIALLIIGVSLVLNTFFNFIPGIAFGYLIMAGLEIYELFWNIKYTIEDFEYYYENGISYILDFVLWDLLISIDILAFIITALVLIAVMLRKTPEKKKKTAFLLIVPAIMLLLEVIYRLFNMIKNYIKYGDTIWWYLRFSFAWVLIVLTVVITMVAVICSVKGAKKKEAVAYDIPPYGQQVTPAQPQMPTSQPVQNAQPTNYHNSVMVENNGFR